MQLKNLLVASADPGSLFKLWVLEGVIAPERPGRGPGIHAEYDEANVIAMRLALKMRDASMNVRRYSKAFGELHKWLRRTPKNEWPSYRVTMTLDQAFIAHRDIDQNLTTDGYFADMRRLVNPSKSLSITRNIAQR